MANTYSGDPATSPKDHIRFLLSDVAEPWMFTDEEIGYSLNLHNNETYKSAAYLAFARSIKYTDRKDKSVGPLSIKYGEIADRWIELRDRLLSYGRRYGGGAKAILTQKSQTSYFRLGQHDLVARDLSNDLKGELSLSYDGEISTSYDDFVVDGGEI